MPRPQFSIRTLLWLTLVVAAFLGGMLFGRSQARKEFFESIMHISPYSPDRLLPPQPDAPEPLNRY